MTFYRGFFLQKQREKKSGPTKMCRYSEFDVIRSVVIEGFDCTINLLGNNVIKKKNQYCLVVNKKYYTSINNNKKGSLNDLLTKINIAELSLVY